MSTRKYMALNPSLLADMSDLASVTSADVDLISSPGSPRRKVSFYFIIYLFIYF